MAHSDIETFPNSAQELITAPPVSDEELDNVATEIRSLQREATIGFALRIGRLIINKIYAGNLDNWRHRGHKDLSFRRLTERLLDISASHLYRAVAIFELDNRIGGVATSQHLGMSHVQLVLALPDKDQKRILKTAEEKEWTVKEVERAAAKARRKGESSGRGGRKPLPTFVRTLHQLKRFADEEELLLGDLDSIATLSTDELRMLRETAHTLKTRLSELLTRLDMEKSQE